MTRGNGIYEVRLNQWMIRILKKRPERFWTPARIATYAGSSWTHLVLSFLSCTGSTTGNWKEGKKPPPKNCAIGRSLQFLRPVPVPEYPCRDHRGQDPIHRKGRTEIRCPHHRGCGTHRDMVWLLPGTRQRPFSRQGPGGLLKGHWESTKRAKCLYSRTRAFPIGLRSKP